MRVLVTTQPGLGHFHPLVPLARALAAAGHEVAFVSSRSFRVEVERAGFACHAAGLDWLESGAEETFPELRALPVQRRPTWFLTDLFADAAALAMAPDLLRLCRDWGPDLLLREWFEFSAAAVAERLGLPHAVAGLEFFLPGAVTQRLLGVQLAQLRAALGLRPADAGAMLFRYLYLSLLPPAYQFPEVSGPPTQRALRPVAFDPGTRDDPAWLAPLGERPLVYATLGTVFNRAPEVFRAVAEGLADEPVDVVLATGPGLDPAALGALPANVQAHAHVPQARVVARAGVVVTHGGLGTTLGALARGVPLVVVPLSAHHPAHATRCAALGVGRVLRPPGAFAATLPGEARAFSAAALRDEVRLLLSDPGYGARARALAEHIASLPPPEQAVPLLERLVEERVPAAAREVG